MSEDIQQQIQRIFQDLESKLRQEIVKWWNDAKVHRPESLPWFTHGIKGLANKLYHGNSEQNPQWKNYRATESHRMSLAEYVSIRTNLETILEAAGPNDAINELIAKLMPLIQTSFEAVSKLVPVSHEPEEEPGIGHDEDLSGEDEDAKTAREAEAAEARDKAEKEAEARKVAEAEQAKKDAEAEKARQAAEAERAEREEQARHAAEAEQAKKDAEEAASKSSGSSGTEGGESSSGSSGTESGDDESSPSTGVIHSLQSYASSDKGTVATLKTIDDLKNVGIITAKLQGGKNKGIQIASNSSAGAEGADDVPRALQDLIKELAGLPESTKDQLGLSSHQTDAYKDPDDTRDFYALPAFYEALTQKSDLFMGITVSKGFLKEMKAYLNRERFTDVSKVENIVSEFRRMLSENKEEDLNIIMSRRMDTKSKSKFLIDKIKQR